MSQLEHIGQMIKDKRDEEISRLCHQAAMKVLEGLAPDFDHVAVAQQISDEVGRILDEHRASNIRH